MQDSCENHEMTREQIGFYIGNLAYRALLEEVYTSPKPGLVDLYTTGAHTDMDVSTFERSAAALRPYFSSMTVEGILFWDKPQILFENIRGIGVLAEKAMYRSTSGVNTHKGLIFNMGILCAAVGACIRKNGTVTMESLIDIEQEMVRDTLLKEIDKMQKFTSNGEKNLQRYGTMGARGEAISGYSSVREIAFPVMTKGLMAGRDWNQVKIQTLFSLMSQVDDSNIIARHNPEILVEVQKLSAEFLNAGGAYREDYMMILKQMDLDFTKKNISAGGCADLLAVTIFLTQLLYEPVKLIYTGE